MCSGDCHALAPSIGNVFPHKNLVGFPNSSCERRESNRKKHARPENPGLGLVLVLVPVPVPVPVLVLVLVLVLVPVLVAVPVLGQNTF